jgi:flavodoxin
MNALVVYYSRTGTTKKVAERTSTLLGCDIEEIHDTTNRSGPVGWMRAGRDSGSKKLTTLEIVKKDPAEFDTAVIGTPIWNHTISTPIRTYISHYKEHFKNVAFFCTGDSTDDSPFSEMELLSGRKPVATLRLHRKKEVEANQYQHKVEEFVRKIAT